MRLVNGIMCLPLKIHIQSMCNKRIEKSMKDEKMKYYILFGPDVVLELSVGLSSRV